MITNQFLLPIADEITVDLFAGGSGASTGIEQATGRPVDIAVNHDREAIALHAANHPQTQHFHSDVFEVDPIEVTHGRAVGLLWASPDCTFHSKARGGKPFRDRNRARRRRGLAGVVTRWAAAVKPRMIFMENVEEFQEWGPLDDAGMPCKDRKGKSFKRWVAQLRNLGYVVEWRELRACDYGAPTIRKRLFLVARRDGMPVVWPEATHAAPDTLPVRLKKLKPWLTAAECIDWDIEPTSIFERKRPLVDATCRRIAKGIMRYVVNSPEPFLVNTRNGERKGQQPRVRSLHEPYWTVTGQGSQGAIVAPSLIAIDNAGARTATWSAQEPLRTTTTENRHAVVSAFLAKHYGGVVGTDIRKPTGTVTTVDHHSLVTANMLKLRGDNVGSGADEPLHTISAQGTHHAEVRAFLIKYYGTDQDPAITEPMHTVTTKARFGLVTVRGQQYSIVDIALRMLTPRELFRAQGFPESFIIDCLVDGKPLTKTSQIRMCGNSVCPPMARALVSANYNDAGAMRRAA